MGGDPFSIFAWLFSAALIAFSLGRMRDVRDVPYLPRSDGAAIPGVSPPSVSAVIAARNEASRIERAVRLVLAQREVDLELLVVDDRSTDETPEILRRLVAEEPRLRVLRVDALPAGWLGKPHACHVGAREACGEWLLFSDADAWMQERLVARAVAAACAHDADHVCLLPGESDGTLPARAALLNFSAGLVHYAARANRDHPRYFVGVGAFNLVRAEAYRAAGGHEALRLEVVDDLMLGRRLRSAGFRSRLFGAARELEVHWAPTLPALVRALEKNMFAMFDFSVPLALTAAAALTGFFAAAVAAPFAGGAAGWAAALAWIVASVPGTMLSLRAGWGVLPGVLAPLFYPTIVVAVLHSMVRTSRDGGVRWRGTFYPLASLRRGRGRRERR